MKYRNMCYIQNLQEDPHIEKLFNQRRYKRLFNYLMSMGYCDNGIEHGDIADESFAGLGDKVYKYYGYDLIVNERMEYVGIQIVLRK